jgi:tetratricopeptide (TPR) repeat protein
MLTIFAGGAAAKNNNPNKGPNKVKNQFTENRGQQVKFVDINFDWAKDEINKAALKGYMKGYGDGKFQPNKPITCLEAIVALISTLEQEGEIDLDDVDSDINKGLLKKIPDWGKVYVAAAIDEGILLESEMKTFNPNQGIKRYQVAVYFARMAENGYGDYIDDLIGDDKEADFDLESAIGDLEEAIAIIDDLIDTDEAEDLNLDEFLNILEDFLEDLEDLDEESMDQKLIDEFIDEVEDLMDELDDINEDAKEEEYDDIVTELKKAIKLLKKVESSLNEYSEPRDQEKFRFKDKDQIPLQARESIKLMQKLCVMFGDTDGKFSPMRVVKRNEIAAMLNRLDDNYFCKKKDNYDQVAGILDDIDYDADKKIFTLIIIDEKEDFVDEIEFTDEDRLYYDGKRVNFRQNFDEDQYAAIEDIKTGGKIKVCLDDQDQVVWVKIYSPEED